MLYDFDFVDTVLVDTEGNIIVIGTTTDIQFPSNFTENNETFAKSSQFNVHYYPFVTKFSPNGAVLWTRLLPQEIEPGSSWYVLHPLDAKIDYQDNIIIAAFNVTRKRSEQTTNLLIIKLSANGTILWKQVLPDMAFETSVLSLQILDDSSIVVATISRKDELFSGINGSTYYNYASRSNTQNGFADSPLNVLLFKFSKHGDSLWSMLIGGSSLESDPIITTDNESNILIIGNTASENYPWFNIQSANRSSTFGLNKMFLTKINANGSIIWSRTVSQEPRMYHIAAHTDLQSNLLILLGSDFNNGTLYSITPDGENITKRVLTLTLTNSSATPTNSTITYDFKDFIIDQNNDILITGVIYLTFNQSHFIQPFLLKVTSDNISIVDIDGWKSVTEAEAHHLVMDSDGNIILSGIVRSADYIVRNAAQEILKGNQDVFITKLNSNFSLSWSTYWGSAGYFVRTCAY